MAQKTVDVNDANIKTAFVQVNQLVISNRKMTLQIFKQIQEENIIDFQKAELKGQPWGHVNYYWSEIKDKKSKGTHHVLWQKGEELRRCFINGHYFNQYRECLNKQAVWHVFPQGGLKEETPVITVEFTSKTIHALVEKYGSVPKFQVYLLKDFQEKMKDLIKAHSSLSYNNWKSMITLDGKRDSFNNHFWNALPERYDDFTTFTEKALEVGTYAVTTAYEVYVQNHLEPCNQLVDEVKKDLPHLYI